MTNSVDTHILDYLKFCIYSKSPPPLLFQIKAVSITGFQPICWITLKFVFIQNAPPISKKSGSYHRINTPSYLKENRLKKRFLSQVCCQYLGIFKILYLCKTPPSYFKNKRFLSQVKRPPPISKKQRFLSQVFLPIIGLSDIMRHHKLSNFTSQLQHLD